MDAKKSRMILLIGYCVPYVFLCLYGDAVWGTGLVYAAAAAVADSANLAIVSALNF